MGEGREGGTGPWERGRDWGREKKGRDLAAGARGDGGGEGRREVGLGLSCAPNGLETLVALLATGSLWPFP